MDAGRLAVTGQTEAAANVKLEWKPEEETVDAFGNVVKIKQAKKSLNNKEKKKVRLLLLLPGCVCYCLCWHALAFCFAASAGLELSITVWRWLQVFANPSNAIEGHVAFG